MLGLFGSHETFGKQLSQLLAEIFDLSLESELLVAALDCEVAVVKRFDFSLDLVNAFGSRAPAVRISGRPIKVSAATNFVSRLGSGRMPWFSFLLRLVRWSQTREMKKRSFDIWMAIGWISTPYRQFSIR